MTVSPGRIADGAWPLVARDEVRDRALATLGRPGCRVLVLAGESGVGKSRLAAEVLAHVAASGRATLRVPASSLLSDVPLGAMSALPTPDGAGLPTFAHDPGALFAAARAAIAALSGDAPAVVLVDDLPHLDAVSTTLVARLVATGDVTLLATQRDGEELPDPVLALWSPDSCLRIPLDPLAVPEVEELLGLVLGGPIAHHAAVELHAATDGNPLYLREVVLGALESDRLAEAGGVWQLIGEPVPTPALRELVRSRVRRLGDDAMDVVERLAVCSPLPLDQLPGTGATAAVAALDAAGWISIVDERGRSVVRLAHPQYAAAIGDALPRTRVAEIVASQAAALEASSSDPADALRVARWRLAAGAPADPATLATAAALAHQARDHRAVERFARAALESAGPRADLLLLRGEALGRLGRAREAIVALEQALEQHAADPTPPELRSGILAALADAWGSVPGGMRDGLAVLDRLEHPDPTSELIRSVLLLYDMEATAALEAAEGVGRWLGDSPAEQAILAHARALPLAAVGRTAEGVAAAETALAFARGVEGHPESPLPVALAAQTLAVARQQACRLGPAQEAATTALAAAAATDDEALTRISEFRLGQIALDQGRLDAAARWFRESRSGAMALGPESLISPSTGHLAITLVEQGDLDGAAALVAKIPADQFTAPPQIVADALVRSARGEVDAAQQRLLDCARESAERGFDLLAGQYLFWVLRFFDAATAAERLAELAPTDPVALQTRHARAEADADRAALEEVAAEWEQRGALLWAAEALTSAARAARASGDLRRAGILHGRASTLAARCEGAATPLLRYASGLVPLTPREQQIAELAARGRTSREIGADLHLSVRTVDNHLQSVFAKLGVRTRGDLAEVLG